MSRNEHPFGLFARLNHLAFLGIFAAALYGGLDLAFNNDSSVLESMIDTDNEILGALLKGYGVAALVALLTDASRDFPYRGTFGGLKV